MPTYVYRCEREHEFEAVQGINDEPLNMCRQGVRGPDNYTPVEGAAAYLCSAGCWRVIQRTFFKITGGGVYKPGFQ